MQLHFKCIEIPHLWHGLSPFLQPALISWKLLHMYADHLSLSKDCKLRIVTYSPSCNAGRSWQNWAPLLDVKGWWFIFTTSIPKEFFLLFHLEQKPRKMKKQISAELTFSCFQPSNFVLHYLILFKWMKCLTTFYGLVIKNEKYHVSCRDAEMGESSRIVEESDICTPCWNMWPSLAMMMELSCVVRAA